MVKGDKVRLNHELLLWGGFTRAEGVWKYPDGTTVDDGVPFFPESFDECERWFLPILLELDAGLRLEYADTSVGDNAYVVIGNAFKPWDTYENYEFYKRFGDVEFEAAAKTLTLAFCLAIQELIRSK